MRISPEHQQTKRSRDLKPLLDGRRNALSVINKNDIGTENLAQGDGRTHRALSRIRRFGPGLKPEQTPEVGLVDLAIPIFIRRPSFQCAAR